MRGSDWTKILGWPGYRVYQHEIDGQAKTLKLWVRRKPGNRKLVCSGCGRRVGEFHEVYEREVRDLPCFEYRTTVVIELYRVRCPDCGIKAEKIEQLPSKAPFSKRFEEIVGQACESAAARQVARRFGLAESTVRAIDQRYLERWAAARRKPALRQMGVDEIHIGKKQKFLTVVCNLETGEPLWFGRERKKETLDGFFREELSARQRRGIEAACVDMLWIAASLLRFIGMMIVALATLFGPVWEFFRKGRRMRGLVKGKRWLLLSRWVNLTAGKRQELNQLFALNRKVFKAYLLKESLDRLWTYRYEGAMLNYLQRWIDQLRWQRLEPFRKLAEMLLDHLDGILNYCRTKVPLGVVEAVNGNIKSLLRRGRGYKNLRYLLLKCQRMAVTKTEFVVFRKAA